MPPAANPSPLAGRRVLLADDTTSIRRLYGIALERTGAEVVTAADGAEAVTIWRDAEETDRPFEAAVLDYAMPRLDGFSVTHILRARGFEGPIVGVSAELPPADLSLWLAAGCDDGLVKGVSLAELVARIEAAWVRRNGPAG